MAASMVAAGIVVHAVAPAPAYGADAANAHVDILWMRVSNDPALKPGARNVDGQLAEVSRNSALSAFNTFKYVDGRLNQEVSKGVLATFTFPGTGTVTLNPGEIGNGKYAVRAGVADASGKTLVNMKRSGELKEALIFVLPPAPDQSHLVVAITLKP
jgi:hypothetical protein